MKEYFKHNFDILTVRIHERSQLSISAHKEPLKQTMSTKRNTSLRVPHGHNQRAAYPEGFCPDQWREEAMYNLGVFPTNRPTDRLTGFAP